MGVESYVSSKLTQKQAANETTNQIKQEIGDFYKQFQSDLHETYDTPELLQKTTTVLTASQSILVRD